MAGIFNLQRHKQNSKKRLVKTLRRPVQSEEARRESFVAPTIVPRNTNPAEQGSTPEEPVISVMVDEPQEIVIDVQKSLREGKKAEVEREDLLLSKIDEFREKAKQLQELLVTKESQAQELETIVQERETKADELQQILDERQQKADGISEDVKKQIDALVEKVNEKMQEIEHNFHSEIYGFSSKFGGEMDNLSKSVSHDVDGLGNSLRSELSNFEISINNNVEETRRASAEQSSQMLDTLSELNDQLVALKQDIVDRVHSENVKNYRNVQDLFKVQGEKLEGVNELRNSVNKIKAIAVITLILGVLNIGGIATVLLHLLGIINF